MREIKFRAWHKEEKIMGEVLGIDILHKEIFFSNEDADCYGHTDFKDIELMQYTGLKDKNEKEIYEGDIIICKYGPQIAMEVKWVDEGFRTLGKYDGDNYVGFVKNNAEVIGNIYENKNLLEENN